MSTILTLTIDKSVIQKAKKYAKENESSLSDIVENFLKAITKDNKGGEIEITPFVKSLKGSFKAPKDFDYKEQLAKTKLDKFLRH